MTIKDTPIEGLKIIEPRVFGDKRGYFFESYLENKWSEALQTNFVQDNESQSAIHVLRGLHFQKEPHAQAKLVRVVKGSVLDVAVDIRPQSKTFGQHFKILLSAENKTQFFIPAGFAHGFLSLEEGTILSYKCSDYYDPASEGSVLWNDPSLNIEWGVENPLLSEKDTLAPLLEDLVF